MIDYKLHIPGPVNVSSGAYQALTTPVMGHRSPDFVDLYNKCQPLLQKLFQTEDPVFLSTSSAWGVMEGAIRNLTQKKTLCCTCGAFSDKWIDVVQRCDKEVDALSVEWGKHIDPIALDQKLSSGEYDLVTLVHNETSCGMMNPLEDIMKVLAKYPDVLSVVDTVSSFSVVSIQKDLLGIDVLLTGSQKALALPPGLALLSVSERAFERAKTIKGRGYYFDFLEFLKNHEKGMTPSTPVIPLIHGLLYTLESIFEEGIENRFQRHEQLNNQVHQWIDSKGFELLPEKKFASKSLSCVKNNLEMDVAGFVKALREEKKLAIDGGYGKIKGKTFRISNMGNEDNQSIDYLLSQMDDIIHRFLPS
jgi:aspartate aminotransferase-like enzyme|tara:strand:- start:4980 stop:6065 length:1086 start_codon:yes stop_codon:yes gene_type:complete